MDTGRGGSNKPIAVGALGGSGTRVVAEILMKAGVFMGDELNGARDNLIFTRLFRDPKWFVNASDDEMTRRLDLFERIMTSTKLSVMDRLSLVIASMTNSNFQSRRSFYLRVMRDKRRCAENGQIWGWKEPNTAVLLSPVAGHFPDLKYIHVVRHGLDMAFSSNTKQLKNWASLFGIGYEEGLSEGEMAALQFDYWAQLNERVIRIGKELLGDRLFILDHSALCNDPNKVVVDLLDFCQLEVDDGTLKALIQLPQIPGSTGRYLSKNLDFMTEDRWKRLRELGYDRG